MAVTSQQIQEFKEKGYFRMPSVIPKSQTAGMEAGIWRALKDQGILQDEPTTWKPGQKVGFKHLREEEEFAFGSPLEVVEVFGDLLKLDQGRIRLVFPGILAALSKNPFVD